MAARRKSPDSEGMRLEGARVRRVRTMTAEELEREGWAPHEGVPCLEFSNGAVVYAASPEGDHPAVAAAQYDGHLWSLGGAEDVTQRPGPLERARRVLRMTTWAFLLVALLMGAAFAFDLAMNDEWSPGLLGVAVAQVVGAFAARHLADALEWI